MTAGLVLVAGIGATLVFHDSSPSDVTPLVKASRGKRTVQARIAGFEWAPNRTLRDVNDNQAAVDPDLMDAAALVLRRRSANATRDQQHAAAVAYLLTGNAKEAAEILDRIPALHRTVSDWSDLAAANYTNGVEHESGQDLISALVAADSAIRSDGNALEPRFNRALIIQRFGLRVLAVEAWQQYLDLDPQSGWAIEAREHIANLARPVPKFADALQKDYERIAVDPAAAEDLARRFPQEIRTWGETEILARWAEAAIQGNTGSAARHLAVARTFGDIVARRGDRLLKRAVEAIETANSDERARLAAAHLGFRDAQRLLRALKPSQAEPMFTMAAQEFDRGHSPVASLALYFRANIAYEQGRIDEARSALETLLAVLPSDFVSAHAQIQWELALCYWARNRLGDAIDTMTAAMQTFDQLGEIAFASAMRGMLATLFESIGDDEAAWKYRYVALRELGQTNSVRLQGALAAAANSAILRKDWPAATSFLNLELDAARQDQSEMFIADALLRRALVLQQSRRISAARDDLIQARAHTTRIPDAGMRAQYEGRLLWVEGSLAPSPSEAITWFTRALSHHETSGRRMFLPTILFERARAHRAAGNPLAASRDIDAAIADLETDRESLSRIDQRWGLLHAADEIFNEAVDLALNRGDIEQALRYSDRGRARTLLDRRKITPLEEHVSVPPGYVIVEYNTTPDRLLIFTADPSGVRYATVPIGRQALNDDVAFVRQAIETNDAVRTHDSLRRLSHELLEPIADLGPGATIVIVPDATLAAVPWSALAGRNDHYLLEEHPVVVSPSAAAFLDANSHSRAEEEGSLLIVANANPESAATLPNAAAEVRTIARDYRRPTILEGRGATPEAFEREARRAEIIHFSGHAFASNGGADETFLLMSNARGEGERLDVRRISAMRLDRTRVVVLAACSTARGRVSQMEGAQSVARAFLAAGSRSVVATLWPIEDEAAADFFTLLHEHLSRDEPVAEALRAAQIESIHASRPPSMWAAVQDIGI